MSKVKTIVDSHGDIWTGRETHKPTTGCDIAFGVLTGSVLWEKESSSVVVNGEIHSGTELKSKDK